jgi:hypothetical protein
MRTKNFARAAAAVLAFGAMAAQPAAAQTVSHYNFVGSVNILNFPGDPTGNTLLLDFFPTGTGVGTVFSQPTVDGVFTPIGDFLTPGVIRDLLVTSSNVVGTPSVPGLPVNPFLTTAGFTFTLDNAPAGTTFGPISLVGGPTGTTAFFGVNGHFFGPSSGTYTGLFTSNFAGLTPTQVFNQVNSGPGFFNKSFSAEFVSVSSVPEPATFALMATGLVTLVGFARRRRQS